MKKNRIRFISLILTAVIAVGAVCFVPAGAEPAPEAQKRTVMFYIVGSNLESDYGCGTWNIVQATEAEYDENLDFIVMTGGTPEWMTGSEYLDGAEEIDSEYDQIWKVEGRRDGEEHGKMVLLEPTGIEEFEKANMTVPETLTAFIDYCYENYPADKYDLILWDHGGGFSYGFGYDDRYNTGMLSTAMIMRAIDRSNLIKDGKKFEIINFDACMMATVEIAAALAPYTDYLVASPEYEPGYGQEYTSWLNAVKDHPEMNGYELGKTIVDGLVSFYNSVDNGYESVATLSVIDTANFTDRMLGELIALDDILIEEAKTAGELNGRYNFYDELYSLMTAYKFNDGIESLYDLGNFVGSLSAPQSEMDNCSAEQIDEQTNAYTDVALQIISILADNDGDEDDVIYAGVSESTRQAVEGYFIRGLDGEFLEPEESGFITLAPTGLNIYFSDGVTADSCHYIRSVIEVLPLIEDEATREYFTKRAVATSYYSLILMLGKTVSKLSDAGGGPVTWSAVDRYIKNEESEVLYDRYQELIGYLYAMDGYASRGAVKDYLANIVAQQADEAIRKDKVDVKRIIEADGTSSDYQVTVNDSSAQSLLSVDSYLMTEVNNYSSSEFTNHFASIYGSQNVNMMFPSGIIFRADENSGSPDFNYYFEDLYDSAVDIYQRIYSSSTSVWTIPQMEEECFVMYDVDGAEHPTQVIYKDRAKESAYIPVMIKIIDGSSLEAFISVSLSDGVWEVDGLSFSSNDAVMRSYFPMNSVYFIGAKFAVCGTLTDRNGNSFLFPISQFCRVDYSADKWGISFGWKSAGETSEIEEVSVGYSITDIYGYRIDVTDLFAEADEAAERGEAAYSVDCAEVTVDDAVYNGLEQNPGVTVKLNGETLERGVDYKVIYDGSVDPGEAYVIILGIGDLVGTAFVPYMIKCAEHSFELTGGIPATCTAGGTREYVCTVCGEEYVEEVAPTGHAPAHVEPKEPTMSADGNIEYWFCADCGACFSDENCENEIEPGETVVAFVPEPGDINGDGEVTVKDLIRLQKYLADSGIEVNVRIIDVNKDGEVNSADLTHLMKYLSGAIEEL